MKFAAIYGIVVGVVMIGEWAIFYSTNQIPELKDEPIRIWFHITGEMITAISLISGGAGLFLGTNWGRPVFLVAMGMLLYTATVSPGYFAQQGDWKWPGVFGLLIVMGLVSLRLALRG